MLLISIIVVLALIIAAILLSSGVNYFIDIPSILIVLLPSLAIIIGTSNLNNLLSGLKLLIKDNKDLNLKAIINAYKLFGNISIWFGAIGVLVGIVIILVNLSDPSLLGPAMAVCLLTLLYAIVIKATICLPIIAKAEKLLADNN